MTYYRLCGPNGVVFVKAQTKVSALRHVAEKMLECRRATPEELVTAVTLGGAKAIESADGLDYRQADLPLPEPEDLSHE